MKHSTLLKTLLSSASVLCIGFAILSLMESDRSGWLWLAAGLVFVSLFWFVKKNSHAPKAQAMKSVLDETQKRCLEQGIVQPMQPDKDLPLNQGEEIYWMDNVRLDYYNTTPHVCYLSSQRFFCVDEDFSFSYPVQDITFEQKPNKMIMKMGTKKNALLSPTVPAFMQAFAHVCKSGQTSGK